MFAGELVMTRPPGTLGHSLTPEIKERRGVALLFLRGDDA